MRYFPAGHAMPDRNEHRSHQRLQHYWESLRGVRPFPSEDQIDSDAIADIWPSCFLVSIDAVTHRSGYRYSYLGQALIEAFGDDSGNPDIALQLLSTRDAPMVEKFDQVRNSRAPAIDEAEFINGKNLTVKYRASLLPLGAQDTDVSHIIGCMRWKIC